MQVRHYVEEKKKKPVNSLKRYKNCRCHLFSSYGIFSQFPLRRFPFGKEDMFIFNINHWHIVKETYNAVFSVSFDE